MCLDEEVKNGKTHALLSLLVSSLLRTAEADIPARGMQTMMKIKSLKVADVRSKGALQNHGLSPKEKKVGQKLVAAGVYPLQAARVVWVQIFRRERNRRGKWALAGRKNLQKGSLTELGEDRSGVGDMRCVRRIGERKRTRRGSVGAARKP